MTHGIMFKSEMILAYLQGMKMQTRRTRGLENVNEDPDQWKLASIMSGTDEYHPHASFQHKIMDGQFVTCKFPYGGVGDTLWFKETWKMWEDPVDCKDHLHYRADDAKVFPDWWTEYKWTRPDPVWAGKFDKWQSAMFMFAVCSRFRNVPILKVRVERLQDITLTDALLEGIRIPYEKGLVTAGPADKAYLEYWDTINGNTLPASKNPWVWVYEFAANRV